MTPQCEEVLSLLGSASLPRELLEHAEGCASCTDVLASFNALNAEPVPPPSKPLVNAVRSDAFNELRRVRRATPWWMDTLALGGTTWAAAAAGSAIIGRHGAVFQNRAAPAALITVAIVLSAIIVWGAYAATVPHGRMHRFGLLVFSLEAALLVGLAGSGLGSGPFFRMGMPCLMTECALSAIPLAVTAWFLLKTAYDPMRTLAAGFCAGCGGLLALHFHCARGTASHLLVFHVFPWIALSVLLVVIRSRLRSRSFAP